jgi:hypothetical protein
MSADKALLELAKSIALCKAYDVAKCSCEVCGLPATRYARRGWYEPTNLCDGCPSPYAEIVRDGVKLEPETIIPNPAAAAIRRLMRIAKGEP